RPKAKAMFLPKIGYAESCALPTRDRRCAKIFARRNAPPNLPSPSKNADAKSQPREYRRARSPRQSFRRPVKRCNPRADSLPAIAEAKYAGLSQIPVQCRSPEGVALPLRGDCDD